MVEHTDEQKQAFLNELTELCKKHGMRIDCTCMEGDLVIDDLLRGKYVLGSFRACCSTR